ncbi:MAG: OmpA family protein [Bacteroidales bacterium]
MSEDRAKSVVDYLVDKGISSQRLVFMGYGFKQPLATNDTEEGRQLNRRTEFKVLEK